MTKELEQDILHQAKTILDKIKSAPEDYRNNPMTQNLMKWYEALIDAVTAEPQESDESLNKRMPALQNKLLGSSSSDNGDDTYAGKAPEELNEGDHITDANGTEHVVLGHKDGNLILETMDGNRSEVPYPVIEKELAGGTAYISSTNVTIPKEEDHFGEEQAEGLDNLLEGLRDTPHDDRW